MARGKRMYVCPSCACHAKESAGACPCCGRDLREQGSSSGPAVAAIVAAMGLVAAGSACGDEVETTDTTTTASNTTASNTTASNMSTPTTGYMAGYTMAVSVGGGGFGGSGANGGDGGDGGNGGNGGAGANGGNGGN